MPAKAAELYLSSDMELVQEFVKPAAWRGERYTGWECVHSFSHQLKRELELLDYTDIVTDSPLYLQAFYAKLNDCPVWEEMVAMCKKFDADHECVNYLVTRGYCYNPGGRLQSESEAKVIDLKIKMFLEENRIKYDKI